MSAPDAILTLAGIHPATVPTIVREKTPLTVPLAVQRRAGIATGDEVRFKVIGGKIVIEAVGHDVDKPTKTEIAAIRRGEAQIARGEQVTLATLLNDLDSRRRKGGRKTTRKVAR